MYRQYIDTRILRCTSIRVYVTRVLVPTRTCTYIVSSHVCIYVCVCVCGCRWVWEWGETSDITGNPRNSFFLRLVKVDRREKKKKERKRESIYTIIPCICDNRNISRGRVGRLDIERQVCSCVFQLLWMSMVHTDRKKIIWHISHDVVLEAGRMREEGESDVHHIQEIGGVGVGVSSFGSSN